MANDPRSRAIVTAADLDSMGPQEVEDAWRASVVTDPSSVSEDYAETLRRRALERLAKREVPAAS